MLTEHNPENVTGKTQAAGFNRIGASTQDSAAKTAGQSPRIIKREVASLRGLILRVTA